MNPVTFRRPISQPHFASLTQGVQASPSSSPNVDWVTRAGQASGPSMGTPSTMEVQPAQDSVSFQTRAVSTSVSGSDGMASKSPQVLQLAQAQIFYALGDRYYQTNHFDHAIDAFTDCIQINPNDYKAYNKRGVAKATIKDYAGAFSDYSKAIALQPGFYNAYINRGNLWVYLGDLAHKRGNQPLANQSAQNALQDFSEAIRINPMNGVAYENRAELYDNLGMRMESLQDKGKAIQLQRMKTPRPMGLPFCPARVALVLANDDYDGTENDLSGGPIRDATRMAQKLRSQGFYVITGINMAGADTKMKVAEFINKLHENPNAVSLVYYSGHGGSINGNNYLIPVNYSGSTDEDFTNDAVSVDYLLRQLKATNSYFNMIFLDACRTPLPESSTAFKSGRPFLKQWETEPGPGLSNTWVEYASRPKQPAMQDNNEGLYTKYLLQYMGRPDLSLKDVSMYTSYALERDPIAARENQHARTQTDLSRTEPIAEAFCFADKCAINRANRLGTPLFQTGQIRPVATLPAYDTQMAQAPYRPAAQPQFVYPVASSQQAAGLNGGIPASLLPVQSTPWVTPVS